MKMFNFLKEYAVDQLATNYSHTILRLPPNHCIQYEKNYQPKNLTASMQLIIIELSESDDDYEQMKLG